MKIAVFHYHLKAGGVTDVIVLSVKAILARMRTINEVRLVTGENDGAQEAMDRIRDGLDRQTADKLRLDILPEISYVEGGEQPNPVTLSSRLEARYGEDTLWWVHNYHLGKNPSFTAALMRVADHGQRNLLFHIHDFPECGRPANLEKLDAQLSVPPYPSGPRIRYAVINERDRKILSEAGLDESVFLLVNPVTLTPAAPSNPEELKTALTETCAASNPGYLPDAPILLYPVRAIRRKNILEAALLARMLHEPVNLIVTLPGTSSQEKEYSDTIERAYKEGLINGVWCPEASGDPRLSYPMLVASCDAIVSTSVQEGFGYLFLNALHWRKPLIARYLDVLDGVLDLFGDYPRRFWADFRVPALPQLKETTKAAYRDRISGIRKLLPEKSLKSIESSINKLAAGGGIDVSYLSVENQLEMLKLANGSKKWLEDARNLNRELLDSVEKTIQASAPDMDEMIETNFGETAFLRTVEKLLESFGEKVSMPTADKVRDSVSRAFGRLDYLRLIYDDNSTAG